MRHGSKTNVRGAIIAAWRRHDDNAACCVRSALLEPTSPIECAAVAMLRSWPASTGTAKQMSKLASSQMSAAQNCRLQRSHIAANSAFLDFRPTSKGREVEDDSSLYCIPPSPRSFQVDRRHHSRDRARATLEQRLSFPRMGRQQRQPVLEHNYLPRRSSRLAIRRHLRMDDRRSAPHHPSSQWLLLGRAA